MFTLTSEICPKKKTDSKIMHLEIVMFICDLCVWLACVWFCSILEWIFQRQSAGWGLLSPVWPAGFSSGEKIGRHRWRPQQYSLKILKHLCPQTRPKPFRDLWQSPDEHQSHKRASFYTGIQVPIKSCCWKLKRNQFYTSLQQQFSKF